VTGSLWMLGGNGLYQGLQFVTFILLARYLEPDAFGYVALATGVFEIVSAAGRWGLSDVMLQRRQPSRLFLSHTFILGMALAGILYLFSIAGILVYVKLHGWTLIAQLLMLLAPMVLLQAAEMVPETVLKQRLDFRWLALRNNTAALVGGLVALVLAIKGLGVYALVVQRLLSLTILLAMVWTAAGDSIRIFPWRRYRKKLFAGIGTAGAHMVSSPLAALLGPRLTDIMVGIFLGPNALGQLKIARRIFDFVAELTIMPLSSVAQAVLPKLATREAELRTVYNRIQGVCALGVFPLFAGLALTAPLWVPLVLGRQWIAAVILIQLASLASISAVVNYFQLPLLIAYRRNKLISAQNIVRLASSVALTAVGLAFGLEVIVVLFVLQGYAFMIFNWMMIKKIAGWSVIENINNIMPALAGTGGMIAVLLLYDYRFHPEAGWINLALVSLVGALTYAIVLLTGFREKTLGVLREVVILFRRKSRDSTE